MRQKHREKLLEKQEYRICHEGREASLKKALVQIRSVLQPLVKRSRKMEAKY